MPGKISSEGKKRIYTVRGPKPKAKPKVKAKPKPKDDSGDLKNFWENVINSNSAEDFWKKIEKEHTKDIQLSPEEKKLIDDISKFDIDDDDDDS